MDNNGNPISIISNSSAANVVATYVDLNGLPLTGQLATFTSSLGNLSPVIGTAVTNSNGIASISLTAGNIAGAAELSVQIQTSRASILFETLGDEIIVRP
ncbi:Ig-like domain-containing protein, partial [Shewanella sp. SG44-6]|uniref:invasin domain 3-containing protein n=3 Tax=Shewanella TaxID=22 RepID=UPI0015FF8367